MSTQLKDPLAWLVCLLLLFEPCWGHAHRKRSFQHKDGLLDFRFIEEPKDLVIGQQKAHLSCSFEVVGSEAVVEWHKDGQLYNGSGIKLSDNSLSIEKPNKTDAGAYQCTVRVKHNSFEWVYLSRKAKLVFPKLGNFAQQPISQKIFEKQFVAFRCALDAETSSKFSDLFQFEWLHNNQKIVNGTGRINILPISHTLEISDAQRQDSGNYTCVVRHDQSSIISQTAFMDVLEGTVTNSAISFALQPRFQTVQENKEVLLECLTNGLPKPNISWLHDGQPIDEKLGKYSRIGVDRSSLLIANLQSTDSGLYSCRSENADDATDASANIIVQTAPQIVKWPKSVRLQETMDVEFDCAVKGNAQVSWIKNGEPIKPSEYFVVNGNKLNIYGLIRDDQAIYQCFAENEVDNMQASVQLLVYEAALTQALIADGSSNEIREPLGLHAQSIGARSIRLKWDLPIGVNPATKLWYSVFYRVEGSSSELVANSSTPSLTLVDLEPNIAYLVRVQATNENGRIGRSSAPLVLRTKNEDAEIGQVRNLRVQVVGADSAQVDWDPPVMSIPKSLRYKFFYRRLNTASDEEEIQSVVVKTSYALHSLRKNSEYSVRVQVVDGSNAGPSSLIVRFHTYSDIPDGPPTNIKLDAPEFGTMRIRWSPPAVDQQNGNLTSYKIRYKTKGRSSKSLIAMANADSNEHKISGLEGGMIYQVRLAAQNQNGTGPFSEWISLEMPAEEDQADEVAPAPSELKVFAGYDSIHVSWLPPSEHSVIIQGYSVGWGVYVPDREKANVGPDDRSYTITGLKPNRDYVISVRAITRAGDGFPIYETVKTTSYAQPPLDTTNNNENTGQFSKASSSLVPPIGVQAESVSSTSIRVSWTDPNNAFNQFYSVRHSHSGGTDQTWRYVNTSETEALIDGLQPNTQYEFAVRLIESQQWSMSALTRTQSAPPSSAPRDLTVLPNFPNEREDPNSVILSWQPPRFSNGDIEEYIVLYSDRLDLPDRDWIIDSAKGDRLSIKISGLLPKSNYFFKIQARNSKGYGPLSPVVTYTPGKLGYNSPNDAYNQINAPIAKRSNSEILELIVEAIRENLLYVVVGTCILVFILVLLISCLCRRGSKDKTRRPDGYMAGRKLSSVNRDGGPDCWIAHPSNRVELLGAGSAVNHNHELKQLVACAVDSPPPRYQTHHGLSPVRPRVPTVSFAVDRKANRKSLPPLSINTINAGPLLSEASPARRPGSRGILRSSTTTKNSSDSMIDNSIMTQSSYESTSAAGHNSQADTSTFGNLYASRRLSTYGTVYDGLSTTRKLSKEKDEHWKRILIEKQAFLRRESADECRCNLGENSSSNGATMPRNYHHSTVSLETRQKTPQIIYTGTNRQHINKIDLSSDRGSSFGGSNLQMSSTPPLLGESGYQSVRQQGNPLRSFVQMNVPPPMDRIPSSQSPVNQPEPRMASVRPVVVASPNNVRSSTGIRPAGIVIGQRSTSSGLAPVGLAHAQPRVNVASIYSPFNSTIGSKEDIRTQNTDEPESCKDMERPMSANSTDIVNPQQFDKMISTLHQLQQQFEN